MLKSFTGVILNTVTARSRLRLNRILLFIGGLTYLLWWGLVEQLLPDSFNPFGSRLSVVVIFWIILICSFFSKKIIRNSTPWLAACLAILGTHYFYLFHFNQMDINWIVGSYVTVIASTACLQNKNLHLYYSFLILLLSGLLTAFNPSLLKTVFLPGMFTIILFSNFELRTRLKLLEEVIERSQRFKNLFDAVFEGIIVIKDGYVFDANESFARILGYNHNEVIGMRAIDFVTPECRNLALENMNSKSESSYEITGLRKDGTTLALEVRGKTHLVKGKSLRLTTISDITLKKKAEQDRILYETSQQSLKTRDEFLSIVSHELKTPLTNIRLQTQMANRSFRKGETFDSKKLKKFVEHVDRQASKLTRLIEEMLDISRISSGKMQMNFEKFDISDLVNEVVNSFNGALNVTNSKIKFTAGKPLTITGDRFRLEQVVENILSNAIKYGDGKDIEIQIIESDTHVNLVIKDHGIGISKKDQVRIFERFERAISPRNIDGLGLGLYISKIIVEAHEGSIHVESELEKGSTFTITLPRPKI